MIVVGKLILINEIVLILFLSKIFMPFGDKESFILEEAMRGDINYFSK